LEGKAKSNGFLREGCEKANHGNHEEKNSIVNRTSVSTIDKTYTRLPEIAGGGYGGVIEENQGKQVIKIPKESLSHLMQRYLLKLDQDEMPWTSIVSVDCEYELWV